MVICCVRGNARACVNLALTDKTSISFNDRPTFLGRVCGSLNGYKKDAYTSILFSSRFHSTTNDVYYLTYIFEYVFLKRSVILTEKL